MIKINLLPQRKAKRADKGQQAILAGLGAVVLMAALIYVFVHRGAEEEIDRQRKVNARLAASIKKLRDKTKDFEKLEAAFESAKEQQDAIERLQNARAVPAWLLHELAVILTKDRQPTMTQEMAKRVMEDPNRAWTQGWDPKHVWIETFEEKGARFVLKGGAQSDNDMTQLILRLQASSFFEKVVPQGANEVASKKGSTTYYNFTITGKVVY